MNNVKMNQEKSDLEKELTQQRKAATLRVEELNECKKNLRVYENKVTELNNLINDLSGMKSKLVE